MMFSRFIGLMTSVLNCGCMNAALICLSKSMRTVPGNFGEIVWGLSDTESACLSVSTSGVSPASRRTNVVLPVPFSPNMTMISESVNEPASTVSLKPPSVFVMDGYVYCRVLSMSTSSAVSTILNESDSSRNRKFSVGMNPSKKNLHGQSKAWSQHHTSMAFRINSKRNRTDNQARTNRARLLRRSWLASAAHG
ncbi:hypothetical protein CERSUDRAFT_157173 [Gelatoporia subvermispora B]|uniref:Secreted protein n=1 Tax=Ceriporiopsis subvermispora (strain B) TaxID=914234 RepID=M2QTP2_CERS8|nr:hypothetical protein CERSUDRAFT_157173 [Gelatoporia subvermispora B]